MNWQNIIVYAVLVLSVIWTIRSIFTKKKHKGAKCANCNRDCELKQNDELNKPVCTTPKQIKNGIQNEEKN